MKQVPGLTKEAKDIYGTSAASLWQLIMSLTIKAMICLILINKSEPFAAANGLIRN